eukprot:1187461-Amphidinium_carterae.1
MILPFGIPRAAVMRPTALFFAIAALADGLGLTACELVHFVCASEGSVTQVLLANSSDVVLLYACDMEHVDVDEEVSVCYVGPLASESTVKVYTGETSECVTSGEDTFAVMAIAKQHVIDAITGDESMDGYFVERVCPDGLSACDFPEKDYVVVALVGDNDTVSCLAGKVSVKDYDVDALEYDLASVEYWADYAVVKYSDDFAHEGDFLAALGAHRGCYWFLELYHVLFMTRALYLTAWSTVITRLWVSTLALFTNLYSGISQACMVEPRWILGKGPTTKAHRTRSQYSPKQ